jgi:hypothetical protein
MHGISLSEAMAGLGRASRPARLIKLLYSVEDAWDEAELHGLLDSSAQAHAWNSLFYSGAAAAFDGDAGFELKKNDDGQRYLLFDQRWVIRFKKFDNRLRTSNYRTPTNLRWEYQLPLDGVPALQRINFGYESDITGMRVERAYLTLPHGDMTEWVWQLCGDQIEPAVQTSLGVTGPVFAYTPIRRIA